MMKINVIPFKSLSKRAIHNINKTVLFCFVFFALAFKAEGQSYSLVFGDSWSFSSGDHISAILPDFDDSEIPNEPRDASAAAIVVSALLELSVLEDDKKKLDKYFDIAEKTLSNLSSNAYLRGEAKPLFLLDSTGNYPAKCEIDASINYADYYSIEVLTRCKKMQQGLRVTDNYKK